MAASKFKSNRNIKGGERHITFSSKASKEESDRKFLQDNPSMQLPLTNSQTNHIPSGTTIRQALKVVAANDKSSNPRGNIRMPVVLPESAEPVYGAPEIHSTLRVGQALVKTRNKKPNLPQLVDDKLHSPNTESRFKKQTSKEVRIPATKKMFAELVSLDISGNALAQQLEEHLEIEATAVKPTPQPQDPEPELEDYFNPEDYVTTTRVTSAKTYRPFSCVHPQTVNRQDYLNLSQHLLGSPFR